MRLTYKNRIKPFFSGDVTTFCGILLSAALRSYGIDFLNWDVTTIRLELEEDIEITIPGRVFDQLMAAVTLVTTDVFYTEPESFDALTRALCRGRLRIADSYVPLLDIVWAVTEAELLDPEPVHATNAAKYSEDVLLYIMATMLAEGVTVPPKVLQKIGVPIMQPTMSMPVMPLVVNTNITLQRAATQEIDAIISMLLNIYQEHLYIVGVSDEHVKHVSNMLRKQAEWTSEENAIAHAEKHADEFGGVDAYFESEREHASTPAGDEIIKDIRCRFDTGDCTISLYSDKRGTVYVKRLSDGRTVTLYKVNKPPRSDQ